jgi:hypothetical protein
LSMRLVLQILLLVCFFSASGRGNQCQNRLPPMRATSCDRTKTVDLLSSKSFTALINGKPQASRATFRHSGVSTGSLSCVSTAHRSGFHVCNESTSQWPHRAAEGLYIFETHQVAVNTLNSDCEVRFDEDTYTMMEQKKDIASTGMGANLMPGMYWCYNTGAQVLKTLPWCYTWRIASAGPTMIVLEGEFSVKCMKLLDDACLLQIAEYAYSEHILPQESLVLTKGDTCVQWSLAAKYNAFEFKDKLSFSDAKAYAIQSLKHALQLLACKELVILDFW